MNFTEVTAIAEGLIGISVVGIQDGMSETGEIDVHGEEMVENEPVK